MINLNTTVPPICSSDSLLSSLESVKNGVTPPTNRGSECKNANFGFNLSAEFSSRIDWFQGTFELPTLEKLSQIKSLVMLDGDQVKHEGDPWHSGKRWEHHGMSIYGLMWAWDDPIDGRPGKGWICVKGSYLSFMEPQAVHALLRILILDCGVKVTRIDFALDDFSKSVTPAQVLQCGFNREFGRFKRPPRFSGDAEDGSLTVTFGSRAADKLLRIYDKAKESKGEIDAIRWEIEFKDEVAHAHACQFIDCPWEELPYEFVAQAVVGSVEFVRADRRGISFNSYCRLPWWTEFRNKIGAIRLPVPRLPQTLQRRLEWARKSWGKSLASLSILHGPQVLFRGILNGILEDGKRRLTNSDLNLIKAWEHELEMAGQT